LISSKTFLSSQRQTVNHIFSPKLKSGSFICSIVKKLGLNFEFSETFPPVADFTPAPSLSNFTFHFGDQFLNWQNDFFVGSLRAQVLFRIRIEEGKLIEKERLLTKLGRIRDVEMGYDGLVYLLIEHNQAGSLVRIVPNN